MGYARITNCRICGSDRLNPIIHLGVQALTGVFPRTPDEPVASGPLELVKCDEVLGGCGLVQLGQSYPPESMYGHNYGYRSGLNQSMVNHLHARARHAASIAKPTAGDVILDIGSNDSTTLRSYPNAGYDLVGMDPTGVKFASYYPEHVKLIPEFFNAASFEKAFPGRKAKIVTSFSMFYDLDDPQDFMRQIHQVLADDGIWVFEQSYLPSMLDVNAYDTICHEHLSYYAMRQIKWMTDRADLKILDVELNDVNGGSFCITTAKRSAPYTPAQNRIDTLIQREEERGLGTPAGFESFKRNVFAHRGELQSFVRDARRNGKTVYGYGASTKGNVLLQFCEFTRDDIAAIAEVNTDKFGSFTPQTLIPICSEADVHARRPDYLLVLPWHFRRGIVEREAAYVARGGNLVFPLPHLDLVSRPATRKAA